MARAPTPFKTPAAIQTPLQPATVTAVAPSAGSWPITGDVADLNAIIQAQIETIEQQEILLHAYQSNLNAAQNPTPGTVASGSGTGNGTQLAVTGVTGTIKNGATVADTGNVTVPVGITILGQISGTVGGAGTYLTSGPTTASATALTFTPLPTPVLWPTPQDPNTLNLLVQQQTAIIRVQTALLQHYQDVLNTSQTAAPPTGP